MIRPGRIPSFETLDVSRQLSTGVKSLYIEDAERPVDHVAQVLPSPVDVDRSVSEFERQGAVVVEEPYVFPDGVCDARLTPDLSKYMATVQLASGLLVLSAPMSAGDQLSRHLDTFGPHVPHHIAVLVDDVEAATPTWRSRGYRVGPVTDDGELAQVFMTSPQGFLIELISRKTPNNATFSCGNVAALSVAEEALRAAEAAA